MEEEKIKIMKEIEELEEEFIKNMDTEEIHNAEKIEENLCYKAIETGLTDYITKYTKSIEDAGDSEDDIETSAIFHMREIASKLIGILGVSKDLYLDYDFEDMYVRTHMMISEMNDNLTESLSGMITGKNLENVDSQHIKIFWSGWNEGSQRVGGIISKILHDDGRKIGRIIETTKYSENLLNKCGKWSMEGYIIFKVIVKMLEFDERFKKFYDELDLNMIDAALIEEAKDFEKEKLEKEKIENLTSGGGLLSALQSLRPSRKNPKKVKLPTEEDRVEEKIVKIENLRRAPVGRQSLRRPSLTSQRVASQKMSSEKLEKMEMKNDEDEDEDDDEDNDEYRKSSLWRDLTDKARASTVGKSDTLKRKLKNFTTKIKTIINLIRKELWDNISLQFAQHVSDSKDTYSLIVLPLELYKMKNFLNKTLMKVELPNMKCSKIGVIFFEYIDKNPKMSNSIEFYQLNIEKNTLEKINTVVGEETAIQFIDFGDDDILKRQLLSLLKNYYTEKKFTTKTLRTMMEREYVDKDSKWADLRRDFRRRSKQTRAVAGVIEEDQFKKHIRRHTRRRNKKINKKYRERITIPETIKKGVKKVKRVTRRINKKLSRLTRRKKRKN